jgi:hypothetical protein
MQENINGFKREFQSQCESIAKSISNLKTNLKEATRKIEHDLQVHREQSSKALSDMNA